MAQDDAVQALCGQLIVAVEIMMNPAAGRDQRVEAYQMCEEFKQSSPLVVQCGLVMCQPEYALMVRHFGLKILEDTIKLKWNNMSSEQKLFIKDNVLRLMQKGSADLMQEATYIKDGISRLCVEIIKREWPQQWPSLLFELDGLCKTGDTATELVMMVLQRLVEDVALLQNLNQQQRRKEIYAALTGQMDEIFQFLHRLLESQYGNYLNVKHSQPVNPHGKVSRAILNTFGVFVEWVPMIHIMANDKYLLRCLCILLSDDYLQLNAADCLLNVVSWKAGKTSDRLQLLALFSTEMMTPLFQAIEQANQKSLEEDHYIFLKKMVEILAELGSQLVYIWAENKSKQPENFETYLNALLSFTQHQSHSINHMANDVWLKFFRHSDISSNSTLQNFKDPWVKSAAKKLIKTGLPSKNNSPSCSYSILDFDSDEEFLSFFGRYRVQMLEGMRLISSEHPGIVYQYGESWLVHTLSNKVVLDPEDKSGLCTEQSPTYMELEATALLLDSVFAKINTDQLKHLVSAPKLAQMCLEYQTPDPTLASVLLSCVSAMFPIIVTDDTLLMTTMNKIFASILNTGGLASPRELGPPAKSLRRHGCALLVKVATRQSRDLLKIFDHLKDSIVNMKKSGQILQNEYSALVEALVLISNEVHNFKQQSNFISAISEPIIQQIRALEPFLQTTEAFVAFTGLDKPALPYQSDPNAAHRNEIRFCLNFLLAIVRRACYPGEMSACQTGGFIAAESESSVMLRNPCWPVVQSALKTVLILGKTLNGLWHSGAQIHQDFSQVTKLLQMEIRTFTSVTDSDDTKATSDPQNKAHHFVVDMFEGVQSFLTQVCTCCGIDFYQQPQLAEGLVSTTLDLMEPIPDFRIRATNRFVKNLINKCPQQCFSAVLAPVLLRHCPFMFARLTERWSYLMGVWQSPSFDENNTESKEVIEDVVLRHLTREYLDTLKSILTGGNGSEISKTSLSKDSSSSPEKPSSGSGVPLLSDLGNLVLGHESLRQCILVTLLRGLVWPDSPSSIRSSGLIELILPLLAQNGLIQNAEASQIMIAILSAIHELGQHEGNYISLMQLAIATYELLRPKYPGVAEVLAQVPGCNQEVLVKLDSCMASSVNGKENGSKLSEKAKKDMFKKIINQFIGKDVAKMFKHDVVIKNLPGIVPAKPRHKTPSLDEVEHSDIGIGNLFGQNA